MKSKIECPNCGFPLFYRFENTSGKTEHKCKKCKQIVTIELKPLEK